MKWVKLNTVKIMRQFDYTKNINELLTPEIVGLISKVHEYKGKYELHVVTKSDLLYTLIEISKYASTESSNRIEGIYTSNKRLAEILRGKSVPRNRNEEEIIGYKKVLDVIHENHGLMTESIVPVKQYLDAEITPDTILRLHEILYSSSKKNIGGQYKSKDNLIVATDVTGGHSVRFRPLPASYTPSAIENLCKTYNQTIKTHRIDPLLLIPLFVLDFLCIHPFDDGNGRISRLLMLLLLYDAGYFVGKYISIAKAIEETKLEYYDALNSSCKYWLENLNDPKPFIQYFLDMLIALYGEFEEQVANVKTKGVRKTDIIKQIFDKNVEKITKSKIMELYPNVSKVTVERTLTALQKDGYITRVNSGKYTSYIKTEQ